MNKIYQGKTVWIVSGFGRTATMRQVYVAKSFTRQTEELGLVSDFVGTKEVSAQENIEDLSELSALMAMCRSHTNNLFTFSQSLEKIKVLHSFIEDRFGNQYDVSVQAVDEIFISKRKAKRRFLYKPRAAFYYIDEAHTF